VKEKEEGESSGEEDADDEMNKEMGETEEGAEQLDKQVINQFFIVLCGCGKIL